MRHHPVLVHQPQDRACDKGPEDDLEPQNLCQDGEANQEKQGAAHPDLGARVLQVSKDHAQSSEVFDLGDRNPYGGDEHDEGPDQHKRGPDAARFPREEEREQDHGAEIGDR
jgi:hypothetical protein